MATDQPVVPYFLLFHVVLAISKYVQLISSQVRLKKQPVVIEPPKKPQIFCISVNILQFDFDNHPVKTIAML